MTSPASGGGPVIEILIYRGEKLLGKREFQGSLVTIGAATGSSLRFVGIPGIADSHALVWAENGALTIVSSSGAPLQVNGSPTSMGRPTPTDFVGIGPLRLQMRLHAGASASPSEASGQTARSDESVERHDEDEELKTLVVSSHSISRSKGEATPQGAGLPPEGRGIDKLLGMLEMELAGTKPYVALPDGDAALDDVSGEMSVPRKGHVDTDPEARPGYGFEEAESTVPQPSQAKPRGGVPEAPRGRQEPVFFALGGEAAAAPPPPAAAFAQTIIAAVAAPPPPPPPPAYAAPPPTPVPPSRSTPAPYAPPPAAPPPPAPTVRAPAPTPVPRGLPHAAPVAVPTARAPEALPSGEPAPRKKEVKARSMPELGLPTLAPPPKGGPRDWDDDDDEDANFAEPFSLLEQISTEAGVPGGQLALQVTVVRNRKLIQLVTLDRGAGFSPFFRGRAVVRHGADGNALLSAAPNRTIRLRQTPNDPAKEVSATGKSAATFPPGGSAIIREGATDLVVSFIRRPIVARETAAGGGVTAATHGGGSLLVHMTIALALTVVLGNPDPVGEAAQEHFDVVSTREIGLEPPPPPPPPPPEQAPVPQPLPAPSVAAAQPLPQIHPTARRAPSGPASASPSPPTDTPPPPSAAEAALAQLESMSSATSSSSSLREAIGSIDAAASSGGSAAVFHVAGPVGQLPGGEVRIGRPGGGGGGPIETRDLAQATKGGAIGNFGGPQGTRVVRGRVSGAGSRLGGQGTIDRAAVQRVINAHQGQIAACYERALLRDPGLAGRVVMSWLISPSGSVGNVSVSQSSMSNSAVTSCISSAIRGWRFPQPQGGSVTVSFPYVFRPVGL